MANATIINTMVSAQRSFKMAVSGAIDVLGGSAERVPGLEVVNWLRG